MGHWGFSDEIQETLNPDEPEPIRRKDPNLADVVAVARRTLNGDAKGVFSMSEAQRLAFTADKLPRVMEMYKTRLDSLASAVA